VSAEEALEAHGTGTALGDPIEVGAVAVALCRREHTGAQGIPEGRVACASLKANVGHLETVAAAAGLKSILVAPLAMGHAGPNALLHVLNTHLTTLVSSCTVDSARTGVRLQVELSPGPKLDCPSDSENAVGAGQCPITGRLSSFGFSGTIAHAQLGTTSPVVLRPVHPAPRAGVVGGSLFRGSRYTCGTSCLPLRLGVCDRGHVSAIE